MNRDAFWNLIGTARGTASSNEDFLERAGERLAALPPAELASFAEHLDRRVDEAYRWDLWAAAYIIGGGCSDDAFLYFRGWLVSRGRATYEAALADPGSLVSVELADPDEASLESFLYLAAQVNEARRGDPFPPRADPSPREPLGEPWEEESVDELFPRLAAKYTSIHASPSRTANGGDRPRAKKPWWKFW